MVGSDRYQAGGSQAAWQHGSGDKVLLNKLGIVDPMEMGEAELHLLLKLYDLVLEQGFPARRLDVADLKEWHRLWLGNLYDWAGEERTVNLSKGDFHFAAAAQLPRLLRDFETRHLHRYTPCHRMADAALVEAIAQCHVELILIHPFREGNGRLSRLLADVMAVQAGDGPLDYSAWDADKVTYFSAIQRGMDRDYAPMCELVSRALDAARASRRAKDG